MRRTRSALFADLLTLSRLGLALLVIPAVSTHDLELTALIVSTAWGSNFLDGRIARLATHQTRTGPWYFPIFQ